MVLLQSSPDRSVHPAVAAGGRDRIVAFVDDEPSRDAILRWLREQRGGPPARIVLLAALPKPDEVRARGIFRDKVCAELIETGRRRLAGIARTLDAEGLAHESRVEIADAAEAILRVAREEGAGLIVIFAPVVGAMHRRLGELRIAGTRSVAARVAELAECSVLVLR